MSVIPEEAEEREKVAGALRLLDRVPPAAYLREWTERIAAAKEESSSDSQSVLIFRIENEWLALPTPNFQEVAENPPLHSLPHRRNDIVLGLVSIRGELLICASLAAVLGIEHSMRKSAQRPERSRRVLMADRPEGRITFPVDEVAAIRGYHPSELLAVPSTLGEKRVNFTAGLLRWQNRTVGCLQADVVFRALERGLA